MFASIIVLGQLVFSLGGFLDRLWVMEVGRFIFGIGGESLAVAQNTYAVSWFKGKELNMVFGFQVLMIFLTHLISTYSCLSGLTSFLC